MHTTDQYEATRQQILEVASGFAVSEKTWYDTGAEANSIQEIGCGYFGNCVPFETDAYLTDDGNKLYSVTLDAAFRVHPGAMFAYDRADQFMVERVDLRRLLMTRQQYVLFKTKMAEIEADMEV